MRIEQLHCLVDITQTHSITNTAERLFMTQQAVSSRIRQLEQELEVDLLVRTNVGVNLTTVGEEVAKRARQMIELEQDIVQLCTAENRKDMGKPLHIRVCSTSSVANIVLPDIVAKLDARNQKVRLQITLTNDMDDLFAQVRDNQCDIGFLTYNETELERKFSGFEEQLHLEILARDELIAVTERKFCREGQELLTMEEFRCKIITLYNIVSIDESKKVTQQETMVSSNDADFHRRMIEKTGAIVIMPSLAYQSFFSAKKYAGLSMEFGNVPLIHGAVYRKDADQRLKDFATMIRHELYLK